MLTQRGRFTLALGAGTYLGAWAFGAHVLYAPAIGLLLAVGAALIWTNVVARPLRLHRQLDRDRPVEGVDVVVRVELEPDGDELETLADGRRPLQGVGGAVEGEVARGDRGAEAGPVLDHGRHPRRPRSIGTTSAPVSAARRAVPEASRTSWPRKRVGAEPGTSKAMLTA